MILEHKLKQQEAEDNSIHLWGSHQAGKSILLKVLSPHTWLYDMLRLYVHKAFQLRPALLREKFEMSDIV